MPDVENGLTLEEQTAHVPLCATALEGPRLGWRKLRTRHRQDFICYDGERIVARVYRAPHSNERWRWSLFGIARTMAGVTHGEEDDSTEARRKAEAGWRGVKGTWRDPQGRLN